MKRLLVVLILALPSPVVEAASNLTGLWWNPAESGWGITLDHQPKFLFATFFIYGQDGQPTWAVAQLDANAAGTGFSGKLYRVTGSAFDKPFVATSTQATEVGVASIGVTDTNHATLSYTLNGTTVSKSIERQSNKPISITGSYEGISSGSGGPFSTDDTDFTVSITNGSLLIQRAAFFGGTCRFTGTSQQFGSRLSIAGTYSCSDFSDGTWKTDDLTLFDDRNFIGTVTRSPNGSTTPSREIWSAIKLN